MKNLFHQHFKPSDEEFRVLWENSIIALDTNILLNLYRYSETTKNEVLEILGSFKQRIWLPYNVAEEYFKNRLKTTSDQIKSYQKIVDQFDDILKALSDDKRHPFISQENFDNLESEFIKVKVELIKNQDRLNARISNDDILEELAKLFDKQIGTKLDETEMKDILDSGKIRYDNDIPPGYKDISKVDPKRPFAQYGDLIIWRELIKKATTEMKSIILISDDKKEDWWLEQSGRTIGPRPELISEFKEKSGQDFYMYATDQFVIRATEFNKKDVNQAVIRELKDVREELAEDYLTHYEIAKSLDSSFSGVYRIIPYKNTSFFFQLIGSDQVPVIISVEFESFALCVKAINDLKANKYKFKTDFDSQKKLFRYFLFDLDDKFLGSTLNFVNAVILEGARQGIINLIQNALFIKYGNDHI